MHFSQEVTEMWWSRKCVQSVRTIVFCLSQPRRFSTLEISLIGYDKIAAWKLINGTFAHNEIGAASSKKKKEKEKDKIEAHARVKLHLEITILRQLHCTCIAFRRMEYVCHNKEMFNVALRYRTRKACGLAQGSQLCWANLDIMNCCRVVFTSNAQKQLV